MLTFADEKVALSMIDYDSMKTKAKGNLIE